MATKDHKKTGGRKSGTPNKRTLKLIEELEALGINVPKRLVESIREIEALADSGDLIEASDKISAIRLKHDIFSDLLQYLYPKRKAIELEETKEDQGPIVFQLHWADEESNLSPSPSEANASAKKNQ